MEKNLEEKVVGETSNKLEEETPVVETTEGDTSVSETDIRENIDTLIAQNKKMEKEYAKLQRQFTRISQDLAKAKEDVKIVNYIRSNADLTDQVNVLLESFAGSIKEQPAGYSEVELKQFAEAWKFLAKQSDYDENEEEIIGIAEEEGLDPDNPSDLKKAYRIWKGVRAEKIAQDALLKGQKKVVEKKEESKKVPVLQGTSGVGTTPPPDYMNMPAEEVLKALGKTLFKEK